MGYFRDTELLDQLGERIRTFRETADLSQEQVYYATKIGQSNITKLELGKLNTSISQLSLLAKLYGVELNQLLDFGSPIPNSESLKKGIGRFLKKNGIDEKVFFKKKLSRIIEAKLIRGKFFNVPRTSKEISNHINIEYDAVFSTAHIAQAMKSFIRKGLIVKLLTDQKSKFQYRKK